MARDRKRAKQRQRRAQRASNPRVAVEERRSRKPAAVPEPVEDGPVEEVPADVELAETALGRRDSAEPTGLERDGEPEAAIDEEEHEGDDRHKEEREEELEPELEPEAAGEEPPKEPPTRARGRSEGAPLGGESTRGGGNRLINFLRACWAELQRVQWPDRRQVVQATGVVLGFVVIAGAYLGIMDAIFSRLVDAIL
jgi:preprotein translocase subunit SecE